MKIVPKNLADLTPAEVRLVTAFRRTDDRGRRETQMMADVNVRLAIEFASEQPKLRLVAINPGQTKQSS